MQTKELKSISYGEESLADRMQDFEFALPMIEQLRGGLSQRSSWSKLKKIIDALLAEIPQVSYGVEGNFGLYRGRVEKKLLKKIDEFCYCPKDKSHNYGRCHKPLETVFYGASTIDTVLSELSPEIGDIIQIGFALKNSSTDIRFSAIGDIDHCRRFQKSYISDSDLALKTLNSLSHENRMRAILIDAFFSSEFSKRASKDKEYKLTSALTASIFEVDEEYEDGSNILDGIAYPSVAHRGGVNFALKPNSFDKRFHWSHFQSLEITNYFGFGIYEYKVLAKADDYDIESKEINWISSS